MDYLRVAIAAGVLMSLLWIRPTGSTKEAEFDASDTTLGSQGRGLETAVGTGAASTDPSRDGAGAAAVHASRAHFHPHGRDVCASGCALSNHPTDRLSRDKFQTLIKQYAAGPRDGSNLALETLLFYGPQTAAHLRFASAPSVRSVSHNKNQSAAPLPTLKSGPLKTLSSEHRAFLEKELRRNTVRVEVRVVDEHGELRASLPSTAVPLDRRHVFDLDEHNLQPLSVSGTVKRVGLDHLWTRL